MATQVLTDSKVTFNSVNLSAWLVSHDLPRQVEAQDASKMTDTTRNYKPGLMNHDLTLEFLQDFGAGGPDATISPLIGNAGFAVNLKTSSAANATTNPEMQGNYIIESYNPMSGKIGELQKCTVKLKPAGALTRATS